ncbi:TIGR01777 family protein [Desulfovibrio sulfodismutans]|uniref:TIGR01777 family protein n=1 Tax=Desulfolutivibrio sulfodismutans TaxID=63561 RepID=A0A7K3NIB1_9BACT|nr:TIGR01777 family oxidoreductase [Desulfolutivibrio sulfodismutans]NDY55941.1 TIGR01777 family protein [Desulfolutivibrio sulfodismutans]QLA11203.1 TIGR01777 family protein [Desulfolutivibrio sulfodismutans DSM 3696]
MRVIIAGGTGFIGTALTHVLTASGHDVTILTRRPRPAVPTTGGGRVDYAVWDGMTARGWGELAEDAAIVNLAGENIAAGRWNAQRKRDIVESRMAAGSAVVQAVAKAVAKAAVKPRVVVQASAVGYYGDRGGQVLEETSLPGTGFLAETAVKWEQSTRDVEDMGVRRVIVRTGVVLGAGGGALARMLPPFRLGLGGPVGDGKAWFPWIHLHDEVRAIAFLLTRSEAMGPFHLVAPGVVTNGEFAAALGKALGRPTVLRVPAFALRLALGEMADAALLASLRVVPTRLLALGFSFDFPDIASALADLTTAA